ncbi:MAG: DegT/DnrJ/EryC1/StrS family aminotransferase [Aureispira sp.]|nr:DegT/DnrJ/EryC1/StrS family aminotransferase [Aureispira sp.]
MVPFLDLKKRNMYYKDELLNAMTRVTESGWYIQGKEVEAFQQEFANYIGVGFCVGVGNGLDALRLIIRSYIKLGKLSKGDEVIVPHNTFIATVLAISEEGLKPILASPYLENYNLDTSKLRRYLSPKTKAIMPVHLYGQICFDNRLKAFADRYNLLIIEDAAQSAGASLPYKKSGNLGHAAATSFYPGKNLGALGDGGAVLTNDEQLAKMVRALANYGSSSKYIHEWKGLNSRLDELQAAVLRVKLKYLDKENNHRRIIAECYNRKINNPYVVTPCPHKYPSAHVWHLYVIRTPYRQALQQHLNKYGIQTLIHYPTPIYKQGAYPELANQHCSITDKLHQEVLSLPIGPSLTAIEVNRVIEAINSFQ